jgi:hypothetical protein
MPISFQLGPASRRDPAGEAGGELRVVAIGSISVANGPGQIAFTVMPSGAHCRAERRADVCAYVECRKLFLRDHPCPAGLLAPQSYRVRAYGNIFPLRPLLTRCAGVKLGQERSVKEYLHLVENESGNRERFEAQVLHEVTGSPITR